MPTAYGRSAKNGADDDAARARETGAHGRMRRASEVDRFLDLPQAFPDRLKLVKTSRLSQRTGPMSTEADATTSADGGTAAGADGAAGSPSSVSQGARALPRDLSELSQRLRAP